jgi:NAD(P)-dependent dehydrogenase (short-subunit alcohol dehydrogenase family)
MNNMANKQSVVVTGASTGIGWSIAQVLLGKGFQVFGSVRKQADADRLRKDFGEGFVPLLMDVTDEAAVTRAAALVSERLGGSTLAGLVNNAGIVVPGPLLHLAPSELRRQMEVNLMGPMVATQIFGPLLGADRKRSGKPGRVVNISSVAGKLGPPFLGAYVASKHALEGMSESLRRELLLYGIDVIVVAPGAVVTPIWAKGDEEDFSPYAGTDYAPYLDPFRAYLAAEGKKGLPPEVVAKAVHKALTTAKPKTRYAVVPQKFRNWTLPRMLPSRVLDGLIAGQLGFPKRKG